MNRLIECDAESRYTVAWSSTGFVGWFCERVRRRVSASGLVVFDNSFGSLVGRGICIDSNRLDYCVVSRCSQCWVVYDLWGRAQRLLDDRTFSLAVCPTCRAIIGRSGCRTDQSCIARNRIHLASRIDDSIVEYFVRVSLLGSVNADHGFSLIVGYIAIQMLPVPLFVVMGGVRIPESEEIIVSTRLLITVAAVLSAPVWIIGLIVDCVIKRRWVWSLERSHDQTPIRVSFSSYAIGIASLLIWLPVLPWTQAEQYQRWTVENMLERGDYQGAAEWSRRVNVEDLPPHWIPPPRLVYGHASVETIKQSVAILNEDLSDWYADQCRETLRENLTGSYDSPSLSSLDLNTLNGLISLKDKGKIEAEFVDRLALMAKSGLEGSNSKMTEEARRLLETMRSWKAVAERP